MTRVCRNVDNAGVRVRVSVPGKWPVCTAAGITALGWAGLGWAGLETSAVRAEERLLSVAAGP